MKAGLYFTDQVESPAESLLIARCAELGFEIPYLQVNILDPSNGRHLGRVDGLWSSEAVQKSLYRSDSRFGRFLQCRRLGDNGSIVIEFDGREKLELRVTLEAYDVSGQEIRDFLRTRGNMPTKAALFMGEERFPAGSVAYAATLWIIQDELLALSHTAFTGSNNIEDFSERFTKETPYCLNVLPGDGVTPVVASSSRDSGGAVATR